MEIPVLSSQILTAVIVGEMALLWFLMALLIRRFYRSGRRPFLIKPDLILGSIVLSIIFLLGAVGIGIGLDLNMILVGLAFSTLMVPLGIAFKHFSGSVLTIIIGAVFEPLIRHFARRAGEEKPHQRNR